MVGFVVGLLGGLLEFEVGWGWICMRVVLLFVVGIVVGLAVFCLV